MLVATDVPARGIHVDAVDLVSHWDPPEDHKGYLHRSGRTARAGESGMVVTLVLWDQELEVKRLQKRIGVEMPIPQMFSNDKRLDDIAGWDPLDTTVAYCTGLYAPSVSFEQFATRFHGHDERIDIESLGLCTDYWLGIAGDLLG